MPTCDKKPSFGAKIKQQLQRVFAPQQSSSRHQQQAACPVVKKDILDQSKVRSIEIYMDSQSQEGDSRRPWPEIESEMCQLLQPFTGIKRLAIHGSYDKSTDIEESPQQLLLIERIANLKELRLSGTVCDNIIALVGDALARTDCRIELLDLSRCDLSVSHSQFSKAILSILEYKILKELYLPVRQLGGSVFGGSALMSITSHSCDCPLRVLCFDVKLLNTLAPSYLRALANVSSIEHLSLLGIEEERVTPQFLQLLQDEFSSNKNKLREFELEGYGETLYQSSPLVMTCLERIANSNPVLEELAFSLPICGKDETTVSAGKALASLKQLSRVKFCNIDACYLLPLMTESLNLEHLEARVSRWGWGDCTKLADTLKVSQCQHLHTLVLHGLPIQDVHGKNLGVALSQHPNLRRIALKEASFFHFTDGLVEFITALSGMRRLRELNLGNPVPAQLSKQEIPPMMDAELMDILLGSRFRFLDITGWSLVASGFYSLCQHLSRTDCSLISFAATPNMLRMQLSHVENAQYFVAALRNNTSLEYLPRFSQILDNLSLKSMLSQIQSVLTARRISCPNESTLFLQEDEH